MKKRRRSNPVIQTRPSAHYQVNHYESASRVMQVSCDPSSAVDEWYGRGSSGVLGLGYAGSAPRQPIREAYRTASVPVIGKDGVRRNVGHIILGVLIVFFLILLLVEASNMLDADNRVRVLRKDIKTAESQHTALKAELERTTNNYHIGYEAAQRGMVYGGSVEAITIHMPDDRQETVVTAGTPEDSIVVAGIESIDSTQLAAIGD